MRKSGKDEVGKNRSKGSSLPGGGAAGRAYQFEIEHGIVRKELDNEESDKPPAERLQRKISGPVKSSKKTGRSSSR
jgi:hypothetical protein